jgi:hypothetical protein
VTFTRRTLLGCAGLLVAGCGSHATHAADHPAAAVNPDAAALTTARAGEMALLLSYDTAIHRAKAAQRPALELARALHATHLTALGATPPAASLRGPRIHDLPAALATSARTLRGLATAAHNGGTAAVLASIAASHSASGR